MELGRFGDAQRLLSELLDEVLADSKRPSAVNERAELEDLLGQCVYGLGKHQEAEQWFVRAIEHDPHRVDSYDRLAQLRRRDLRQEELAASTIRDLIAKNPRSGRAYVYRWRYAREFAPPADARDLAKGLELAADDREVLIAAAMASEQKRDMATMRSYLEKGCQLDAKDLRFATNLARLEKREGHVNQAVAVLRRAFAARPVAGLAFELADTLVLQGKIEGKDGADELMDLLRRTGFGDTLVRFLEAESLVQKSKAREHKWTDAIAGSRRLVPSWGPLRTWCCGSTSCWPSAMDAWEPTNSGSRPCGGLPTETRAETPPASSWSGRRPGRSTRSGHFDPLADGDGKRSP